MSNIQRINDKVLFFGLPKSGLESVDMFCKINDLKSVKIKSESFSIKNYRKLFPKDIFFIIVRNPWSRMVSMYFYWIRNYENNNMFKYILELDEIPTFTEFIRIFQKKPTVGYGWGLSTHFTILNAKAEDFDIVIKLEEIDEKFKQIQDILGAKIPFPHKNKGNYEGSYQQYYTDETRDTIAECFKYEIDTFGYTF